MFFFQKINLAFLDGQNFKGYEGKTERENNGTREQQNEPYSKTWLQNKISDAQIGKLKSAETNLT